MSGEEQNKEAAADDVRRHDGAIASFLRLLRFADATDVALMIVGLLGSIGDGVSTPSMMLITGSLADALGKAFAAGDGRGFSDDALMRKINQYILYFVYVGIAAGTASFWEAMAWIKTSERQASRLRYLYLRAMLRQDESFFDTRELAAEAEVLGGVSADVQKVQEVIGEKMPHFLMNLSNFVASYAMGLLMAWRLAAAIMAFMPLLVIPGILYGRMLGDLSRRMAAEYGKASAVAHKSIASIRTVYSFVGEERAMRSFSATLAGATPLALQQGLAKGLTVGSNGVVFVIWSFVAWYANLLLRRQQQQQQAQLPPSFAAGINGGSIIATGLVSITGGLSLGNCLPDLKHFSEAGIAGSKIVEMINRVPTTEQATDCGGRRSRATAVVGGGGARQLRTVLGNLELRNVRFAYPARPHSFVLDGFSLDIRAGETTALVGGSGSGKSTVVALLERFYDPQSGVVLLDGADISTLNLPWLRAQMGLVSQEPALFAASIKQNILLGKRGATMEKVVRAAQRANAHGFISRLPQAYETLVGERGIQMSGGQKQRIAIARALLKDPPILLLDEATSALDVESERTVQDALDQASLGRTTLLVSHRLSTVRRAHRIVVLRNGTVVESGSYDDLLLRPDSAFAKLVHAAHGGSRNDDNTTTTNNNNDARAASEASAADREQPQHQQQQQQHLNAGKVPPVRNQPPSRPPSFSRLVLLSKPEWRQALAGTAGAVLCGLVQPLYAFTIGGMVVAFYISDNEERGHRIRRYSLSFAALAIASLVANTAQHYNFAVAGERLTTRVREGMLRKILSFEVGWFDAEENGTGAVCSRIVSEANLVRSLVGDRWSLVVTTAVAIVAATSFGLAIAWRLALVIMASQPIIILCFYGRKVLIRTISEQSLQMQQECSRLAAESVANHRTIAAFCAQPIILDLFQALQASSRRASTRQAIIAGVGHGIATLIAFYSWALGYWYGGRLVSQGHITTTQMFRTFFILFSTGRVIAESGSMTSDIAKGAAALGSVFAIIDRTSEIDPDDANGERPLQRLSGEVELRNVDFAYPQRPQVLVLRDFSLRILAGQSVALVGQSGSGKSTVVGLIERFYDPIAGAVMIDGKDIRRYHLRTLRQQIALVSQEPALFAGSVRENILYGREDAAEAEVVEAAKAANAHDFISAMASGYETNVGERGVQLSGGQKQRIAIARAILKSAAILLLDEATSALDVESETAIQEAVEGMMMMDERDNSSSSITRKKKTTTVVVVAHRLSTIRNCDAIAVVQDGRVVELGTHSQLLRRGAAGAYFNLVRLQRQETS